MPVLPLVERVVKSAVPETLIPEENTPAEETFKERPIPTLPVRSENPLTLSPPRE